MRPAPALRRWLMGKKWPQAIATGRQVHGTKIQIVPRLSRAKEYPDVDGFLTDQERQLVGIYTADCLPVLIADHQRGVIGALHAGWRGVRGKILTEALRQMRRRWRTQAGDVEFWFGPCIQACCFEVGWDVARHFPVSRRRRAGRWTVNLPQEVRREARRLGLREAKRRSLTACTMHESRYFSFRRDGGRERQISIIWRVNS